MRKTLLMAVVALFSLLIFFPQNAFARKPKCVVSLFGCFPDEGYKKTGISNFYMILPCAIDSLKKSKSCTFRVKDDVMWSNTANIHFYKKTKGSTEYIFCFYDFLYRYSDGSFQNGDETAECFLKKGAPDVYYSNLVLQEYIK